MIHSVIKTFSAKPFLSWACLLLYVVTTTTVSGGLILCEGEDGHVAVELASASCHNHESPTRVFHTISMTNNASSCQDTPLSVNLQTNVQSRLNMLQYFTSIQAIVWMPVVDLESSSHCRVWSHPPPDHGAVSLRSVILLI